MIYIDSRISCTSLRITKTISDNIIIRVSRGNRPFISLWFQFAESSLFTFLLRWSRLSWRICNNVMTYGIREHFLPIRACVTNATNVVASISPQWNAISRVASYAICYMPIYRTFNQTIKLNGDLCWNDSPQHTSSPACMRRKATSLTYSSQIYFWKHFTR